MIRKVKMGLKLGPSLLMSYFKPIPLFCFWEITYACNMACEFCNVTKKNKTWKELSTKEAILLIDDLYIAGTRFINFTGGEPTIRKDFPKILKKAKSKGIITFMNTNGEFLEEIGGKISQIDLIRVSLDGFEKDHDKIRRKKGSFDSAIRGIKKMKELNIPTMINSVITTKSKLENLRKLAKKAKELDIKITFTKLVPNLNSVIDPKEKELDKKQISLLPSEKTFFNIVKKLKLEFPKTVGNSSTYMNFSKNKNFSKNCKAMNLTIGIKPDGSVGLPCASDFTKRTVKGKIKDVYYCDIANKERNKQGTYWFCKTCESRCAIFPSMLLNPKDALSIIFGWGL